MSPIPRPEDPKSLQSQADSERAYRQLLVQGVLAILLPTEDLENTCLTALVGEILSELVIGNLLANRISQPWLLWEIFIILTKLAHKRDATNSSGTYTTQAGSSNHGMTHHTSKKRGWSVHQVFWSIVQWGFLAVHLIRGLIGAFVLSRSLPPRSNPSAPRVDSVGPSYTEKLDDPLPHSETRQEPVKVPVVDFHLWPCLANLLEIDVRMPWLTGALSIAQWGAMRGPEQLAGFNGRLDR